MFSFWKTLLLYSQQDRKKLGIMMELSWWPPFAKFCKNHFQLFLSAKHAEKRIMSRWQIPPQCAAWCARCKKAQCHDGNFAMATICEILQKWVSTFFKALSKAKETAVSWWPIRDLQTWISTFFKALSKAKEGAVSWRQLRNGHHLRNFAKTNFGKRKRGGMMANSRWPPFF